MDPLESLRVSDDERLDSWKAIAAYLNRDVRTVQRWERREELPVHRHQHDKLASVYAYRSELRQWQASRRATADPDVAGESAAANLTSFHDEPAVGMQPTQTSSWSTWWAALALVGLVAVGLAAYYGWASREGGPQRTEPLARRRMLPADIGAPDALRSVTPTIRLGMAQAWLEAGGQLLPESALRTTLQLMRRSPQPYLTAEIAREVALRAGGVDFLFEPRIEAADDGYRLTLVAWAGPEAREEVAQATTAGVRSRHVTREFARLTEQVIDALRHNTSPPTAGLPRVTTRTIAALHQFAEADHMMKQSLWESSLSLLRGAIRDDPEFASAYVHLAWVMSNLGQPASSWRPLLERGMALREVATEPEEWFIAGSRHQLIGRQDDAVAAYERVITSAPEHYWALGNLANIKSRQGQHEAAALLRIRRARLNPDSLISQIIAADDAIALSDRDAAHEFRRRIASVLGNASSRERAFLDPWLPLFDACEAWERRDVSSVAAAADTIRRKIMSDDRTSSDQYYRLGLLYLDLGMTRRAEEVFGIPATPDRHQYLAMAAAARNDWPLVREQLIAFSRQFDQTAPATGSLLVEAGLLPQAERLRARWDRERYWPEYVIAPFHAALHVAHGRPLHARRVLDAALPQLVRPALTWVETMRTGGLPLLSALRLQARLQRNAGELAEAAATLEKANAALGPVCTTYRSSGFLWLTLRAELAALYRQRGMVDSAAVIEVDLSRRLALADRDHAVLTAIGSTAAP